jgi:hypothetical protein
MAERLNSLTQNVRIKNVNWFTLYLKPMTKFSMIIEAAVDPELIWMILD